MSWLKPWSRTPEDRFSDEVAGLARSLLGAKVRKLPEFSLEIDVDGSGSPLTMYLGNIYQEARDLDPQARESRLRTAVLAMLPEPRPQTWQEAAPRLMPAVRSASWAAAGGIPDTVRAGLLPFVHLMCAIDSEHAMTFATEGDLHAWGVDQREAMQRAADNLAQAPLEVGRIRSAAFLLGPDGYASSWLAVPGMLARVAAEVGETVVAVAADRDRLVLIDTDDHAVAVDLLQEALTDYEGAARQLSPVPYLVDEAGVRPWQPPSDHPARPLVDQATHLLAAVEYQQQRAHLEDLFARAGEDVFVASNSLIQHEGQVWSWAVWVRQVTDGLLPQVDYVVLGDNDDPGEPAAVPWDDVLRLAAASLERTGYDPPLWRYHGWPDPQTLAELHRAAVPFPPP